VLKAESTNPENFYEIVKLENRAPPEITLCALGQTFNARNKGERLRGRNYLF
jgi:hypothetical protein